MRKQLVLATLLLISMPAWSADCFDMAGRDYRIDPDLLKLLDEHGYKGWMVVEAEQDPALANPFEYAVKARKYIRDTAGI